HSPRTRRALPLRPSRGRHRRRSAASLRSWLSFLCAAVFVRSVVVFRHPPLQGEGRTAEGSPEWGAGGTGDDGDAVYAEALPPAPGPLTRADLPPSRGRWTFVPIYDFDE